MKREILEKRVEELTKENKAILLENSVYQRFIDLKQSELGITDTQKKIRTKKNVPQTLTNEQKYDISSVVNEDIMMEVENSKKESEKMIDTLKALLEETEIKIGELKRDAYEFKRDVVIGAENARTGGIMAERVLKYFDEKGKSLDAAIEKLRLKNSNLKVQIHKVENQIAHKEEIGGDVLHFIDFHQLQIENKQHVAKIKERNDELMSVKLTGGKTLRTLNDYKIKLSESIVETNTLTASLSERKNQLAKLVQENLRITKDLKHDKKQRNRLRQQVEESSDMPNVGDYIEQKRAMYSMEESLRNWRKKLEILEMAAKQSKTNARRLKLSKSLR